MKAAYCLRVMQTQTEKLGTMLRSGNPDSPFHTGAARLYQTQLGALERLQRHLLPRLESLAPKLLAAASERGLNDTERAAANNERCMAQCEPVLAQGRTPLEWATCIDRCSDRTLAARLSACRTPNWLP